MQYPKTTLLVVIGIAMVAFTVVSFSNPNATVSQTSEGAASDESAIASPYLGQEVREIKALSQDDVEGLLAGTGTPFGGIAKPAELNGYPGPRHVLDASSAGEFELTSEQREEIEKLYEEMRSQAISLGERIIEIENEIDDAFASGTITKELLQEKISASADLYAELRVVHLNAHLSMMRILTPDQIEQYNVLRGYATDDPCENTPEGHNPELWKMHNGCE